MNNKLKNEKGSITLYVLISMVFFIVVVYGVYFNTTNKAQKQNKEIEKIQKQYEKEDINDLYEGIVKQKIDGVLLAPTAKKLTYNGSAQALVNAGTTTTGTLQYKLGINGTYSTDIPSATNAGTYTVYYKVVGDSKHNDIAESSIDVLIEKANGKVTLSATSGSITYPNSTTFAVTGNTGGGTLSVSTSSSGIATATISSTTVAVKSNTSAGTAKITVTSAETTNYKSASAIYTATVSQGTLASNTVTAQAYTGTYDGNAHGITVTTSNGGTITYCNTQNGTYSTAKPTYTNAGTYTTYYRVTKAGYSNTIAGSKTVTINKASGNVSLSSTSGIINNKETGSFNVTNNRGGGSLSVTSNNTSLISASLSGNTVNIKAGSNPYTGSTSITVTSSETTNYRAASATYNAVLKSRIKIGGTNGLNNNWNVMGSNFYWNAGGYTGDLGIIFEIPTYVGRLYLDPDMSPSDASVECSVYARQQNGNAVQDYKTNYVGTNRQYIGIYSNNMYSIDLEFSSSQTWIALRRLYIETDVGTFEI